ncbi:anti-repressor SinI family protein (plasmid) [Priestia megaterium]|nr:anti-repressor SinI family protein [Priestia megaterium]
MLDKNTDEEWVKLMEEAYKMGIPIEEVKEFLLKGSK